MNDRPLIIFTHHYPYGEMELFLETEILYLKEKFAHIIVVPNKIDGAIRPVPNGVSVETSFAQTYRGNGLFNQWHKLKMALLYPAVYRELWKAPKDVKSLRKILGYSSEVSRSEKWVKEYLYRFPALQNSIFYTYWFYDHTTGIANIKALFPEISIVSRAHGFDLYEEEYAPGFIPYRHESMEKIDRLILISRHGQKYLNDKFPEFSNKTTVCQLGIEDSGLDLQGNLPSAGFKIVSCSHLIPLKRLPLQIDGIAEFSKKHPRLNIEWKHIGSGPLQRDLYDYAKNILPAEVQWEFLGAKSNKDVFHLYKKWKPHVFLIVSATEGLPVSIMEAFSCGIPAIATAVGGVSEIVNCENGILLSANPHPKEIANALTIIWQTLLNSPQMQFEAKLTWHESYNAPINYRSFAHLLSEIDSDER